MTKKTKMDSLSKQEKDRIRFMIASLDMASFNLAEGIALYKRMDLDCSALEKAKRILDTEVTELHFVLEYHGKS